MNSETTRNLCRITSDFYREHSASFSATRHAPWAGWKRCLEAVGWMPAPSYAGDARGVVQVGGTACGRTGDVEGRQAGDVDCGQAGDIDSRQAGGVDGGGRPFGASEPVSVLDLACGNLRFEAFLESMLPAVDFDFYAVDNCDALAMGDAEASLRRPVHYRHVDVMEALLDEAEDAERVSFEQAADAISEPPAQGPFLGAAPGIPPCDLSVAFGFMHHVPGVRNRCRVLAELVAHTKAGGCAIVSFWRFLNDEGLAEKARAIHTRARDELSLPELDEGDFLLGWRNEPGAYRYCHSFSEAEIDALVQSVADKARPVARFAADGRTGNLNTYVVLRVE